MEQLNWVRRLNYLGHSIGGADKLVSLNPNELIDIAKSTTGLSDFGDDNWKPSYFENVKNLDSSKDLHTMGRIQLRAKFLMSLRNRLFITNEIKLKPAILSETIDSPLIITGLGRTGTTILFELLSQNPSFRSPLCFEAFCPVEPPPDTVTGGIDRKKIAQTRVEFMDDIQPEIKTMHINRYDLPHACFHMLDSVLINAFHSSNDTDNYRWHKKILQLLQYEHPTKPWLLKCTSHINHMEQLLEYYPNARIIHTHRDPVKAIPSLISLLKCLNTVFLETSDIKEISSKILMTSENALRKMIKQRQEATIPEKQIVDVHFQDLMLDPVTTIRTAYKHLGIEFSEIFAERILSYLAKKPRNKHGKHSYQPEDFELTNKKIREQFYFYTDHYNIALDV
jgi:Sulfotransferase family